MGKRGNKHLEVRKKQLNDSNRKQIIEDIKALKDACRKTHKGRAGAACVCICGAAGGGSAACSALQTIRDLITYENEELRNLLKEFL